MKYRESGMPAEDLWNTFLDPEQVLTLMEVNEKTDVLIDIGCGYGTFLFPASKIVKKVIGIDIDGQMIGYCEAKIKKFDYNNIDLVLGDISQSKTIELLNPYLN